VCDKLILFFHMIKSFVN